MDRIQPKLIVLVRTIRWTEKDPSQVIFEFKINTTIIHTKLMPVFIIEMSTNKMERLDRNQWKQYQNMMIDSARFVDLLNGIEWEEGLSVETIQSVESYLSKGKDGQIGITGEGSLIDSSKDVNIPAAKSEAKGITISAARYASEDASILVHFAIAILEYSKLCIPLKAAKEKVESIRQEQIDYDRKKREQEQEVNFISLHLSISF